MDKASKLLAAILMISILSPAFAAEYIIEPPQIPPERQLQAFSESSSPEPLKPGLRRIYGTDSLAGSLTEEEAAELEAQGYTLYENFRVYGFLDESAAIINATEVWAVQVGGINLTGAGQTICVIDSGINYTHSAFGGSWGSVVLGGAAFLNDSGYVAECNETNSTPCFDNNGHGTKLAGILVSQDATYRGIAPDAKLVVVKALEGEYNSISSGYESDIASGVNYCTEHSAEYNISVISLSLGSTGKSSYYCDNEPWVWPGLRDAIDNATAHGIMVVAAAGNNYSTTNLSAPACFYNATPVGAVDKLDAIPAFSNRWELPLVFAPGQNIMTSYWPGGFAYASGTSMAAPHLSGVFALMKQYLSLVGGNLTPQELETRAIYTGTNVTSNANMSRINAYELYLNLSEYLFVVVSAPLNHSIQNSSVLSVSGSSSRSGTNVSVYYTNGTLADSTNLSGLYWSANFTLSDGAYNIVALISNGTNSENVTVSNITLDTVPPQVEIVSPLPSVYLPSKTVLINLTANDTNLNYTNISIYNSTGGLVNSTTKTTNGSYALNLSVQTDGVYNITAISYDLAGNTNLSTINLTIDTISPLAVIEFPESNSTLNSRTLIINFTLVEPNVNGTNLSIRNSTGDVVNSTTSSQNGSVQINLSVPEDGNYNLTFRAYDRAGNNASAVASNITVLTAPTLKIRPSWTETYYLGNATISAGELENTSTTRSLYLNLNQTKILQFFVNNSGVSALENLTAELYGFSNIEANLSWADGCNISEPRNVSAGEAVALNLTIHSNASGLSTGGIYISTLNGEPYPDLNMSLAVNSTNLTIVRLNSSSGIYYSNSTEEVEVEFWVYLYDNSTLDTSWLGAYNATLLNSSGEGAQNLTLSVLDGLFSVTLNTAGLLDGNYTLFGNWTDLNNNSVSLNQSLQLLTPVDIYATVLPNENMVVKGDNFTFRVNVTKSGTQAVGNGTVCIALPGDITNLSGGLCQHFTDSDGNFSMLLNWTLGTSARGTYPINISANFTDFRFDKDTQKNVSVKYGDLDLDWKYSSSDPPSGVDTSDSFYVRVQVTNEGDLNATSVGLEMTYSSSYFTRISGTNPCSLGTLVPNETEYCTWVLQAGSSTVSNSVIQVSVSSAQNATLPSAISRQVDVSVPSTQQTETTTTTTNTVAPTTTTTSIASATFIKPTFSDLTLFQGDDYSFIVNVKNNGTKKLNNLHLQVSGIDSAYYKLGSNTKTILNTGLSRDLNFTFTIPEGASAGTSAVVLKAVSDEGTWTKSINLNVRGFDLAVSGLENLSVTQGENKSVSFSIKNTGGKKLDNLSLSLQGMDTEKYTISPQVVSALAVDASQNCALSFSLPEDFEVGLANITLLVESTEKNFTRGLVLAVLPCEEGKSEILNEYKKLTESFERLLEDYERVDYEKANSTNLTSKVEIANQTMELINQSIERGDYLEASRLINEAQTSLNALESSIAEVKSPAGPGSTFLILVFVFGAMLVAAALFYTYSPKPKQKAGKGYYVPMPGEKEKEKQESTPNKGIKKYLAKFSKKAEQDKERKKIIEEWRKKYGPSK